MLAYLFREEFDQNITFGYDEDSVFTIKMAPVRMDIVIHHILHV